ncbi:RHS repeat-associated core domain-containing protein, partial [Streptomyces sp. NPDC014983]|uniref:RHS repeat-associated core domain-containing protein n=1 Tax=Streptomyces sp. NPDC014983 TaxID=3364933 RepID=UPI0036F70AAE
PAATRHATRNDPSQPSGSGDQPDRSTTRNDPDTPLRFPGQYYDPETGLHYNYFRHYDPHTGRFFSSDPLGLGPAPNPTTYVHNPHVWVDPLGLTPCNEQEILPEGYTPSPALKNDPYHDGMVQQRRSHNEELYAASPADRAAELGYSRRISPQKAPFHSHGQEVFFDGKNYITPDVDGHNVSDGWKMFNKKGQRIGTYDADLTYVKK